MGVGVFSSMSTKLLNIAVSIDVGFEGSKAVQARDARKCRQSGNRQICRKLG
jgi:hypothetical protein